MCSCVHRGDTVTVSEKLRQWIDAFIAGNPPGSHLPHDRHLAGRLGCSVMSVRRVMAKYTARGLLERRHGSGTRIPPREGTGQTREAEPAVAEPGASRSAGALHDDLLKAIASGTFKQGTALPLNKQLSLQLHVGTGTVTAAYRMLEREGYVTKVGKQYWVGGVYGSLHWGARRECIVLYPETVALTTMFTSHNLSMALRKMESRLEEQGWLFRYTKYSELRSSIDRWKKRGRLPDGLLVFGSDAGYITAEDFAHVHAMLSRAVGRMGRSFPPLLAVSKAFVADYRRCHFFSGSHTHTVRARATAQFALMHNPASLKIVLDESVSHADLFNFLRIYPEIREVNKTMRIEVLLRSDRPAGAGARVLKRLYSHFPLDHVRSRIAVDGVLVREDFESMFRGIRNLTDTAAQASGRTMLIFRDDRHAAEVLQWCERNRISVGESILLLSYENNPAYFGYGITACISDWETDGYLMAHALVGDIPIARTSRGFIRSRARILRRLTT
mgnify:CR=1 FL=1